MFTQGLEAVFISGVCRTTGVFARRQGDFPQQSWADFKGNQRSMRAKRPFRRCAMLMKTASYIAVASRNSIAPAGEKKSELCVAPAPKRAER